MKEKPFFNNNRRECVEKNSNVRKERKKTAYTFMMNTQTHTLPHQLSLIK